MRDDLEKLRKVVINNIEELAIIKVNKAKNLLEKYFLNMDKLNIVEKLKKNAEIQLEFLNQLLNPNNPSYSDKIGVEEDITDKKYNSYFALNILFNKIYTKEKENIKLKRIQEKFKNLFLKQITLLINTSKI